MACGASAACREARQAHVQGSGDEQLGCEPCAGRGRAGAAPRIACIGSLSGAHSWRRPADKEAVRSTGEQQSWADGAAVCLAVAGRHGGGEPVLCAGGREGSTSRPFCPGSAW